MVFEDFLSVAEKGYYTPGTFSFSTAIYDNDGYTVLVKQPLDNLQISAKLGWATTGLVVDFDQLDDLVLFTLAYDGPLPN